MRRQSNPITPHETWLELFWSTFNRSSCVFFWQTLLVTATCTKVLVSVFSPSIWVLYQGWISLAAMARRNIIDLFWHTLTARDDTRDREANSSRQNDVAGGDFLRGKQVEHATALSLAFAAAKIKNLPLALEKKNWSLTSRKVYWRRRAQIKQLAWPMAKRHIGHRRSR